MSGRIRYTTYVSNTIPVLFKCEHCGKVTVINHVLKSEATTSVGVFSRTSKHNDAKESVELQARESNNYLRQCVLEDAEKRDYKKAKLDFLCPNCFKRPLWAKLTHPSSSMIMGILLFISFIMFCYSMICIVDGKIGEGLALLLFPVLPFIVISAVIFIGVKRHIKRTEEKIMLMDKQYLPFFCSSPEELSEAIKNISSEDITYIS